MDFLIVDFEFTFYKKSFGRPRNFFAEIIEIGAVKLSGEPLSACGTLQNFVKPHFFPKQAQDTMDFCMITPNDMKKAIDFPEMVKRLEKLYEPGKTYFVAWCNSDYDVLNTCCQKHKLPNPILKEDYLDLAEAYKLWKNDELTTGLKAAAEEQEADTEGLWHTAFDDANNTGKVLIKMLEKDWTPEQYFETKMNMTK